MRTLNHFAISAALHSEIVGPTNFGHGQIGALGDGQRFFNALRANLPISIRYKDEVVDVPTIIQAFRAVRNDRGSPDLYVADPGRNAKFLAKCRQLGVKASDYRINKTLFNARKTNLLTGLNSKKTVIQYEAYAFASEYAATELRYLKGASIDDILCDPSLATQFDSIAMGITPGHSSLDYRWAILSLRKSGRHQSGTVRMPSFTAGFKLTNDPIIKMPDKSGVYLLYEKKNLLYASASGLLRDSVVMHRNTNAFKAISDKYWQPDPQDFTVSYAAVAKPKGYLQAIERRIVEKEGPVFNIPRSGG